MSMHLIKANSICENCRKK